MVIFPGAKINIGLRITQRRADGYHNLQTIFYPIHLNDALEFVVPDEHLHDDILTVTGLVPGKEGQHNLVIRALNKLREYKKIPCLRIHLHKVIPSGAGLGGGSSDASFFLKSLNRYFDLGFDSGRLKELSLEIGSDCPFFIDNIPVYAEGRGEIMTPVDPLPTGYYLVLVKPAITVSTKDAFSKCTPYEDERSLPGFYGQGPARWNGLIINDFEKIVFENNPKIKAIKDVLYGSGALFSSMSGSGSTVYGIYDKKPVVPPAPGGKIIYSGIL
jgi:4-diphosphocytidyl-2-C-methyl-D-erythritol kinase